MRFELKINKNGYIWHNNHIVKMSSQLTHKTVAFYGMLRDQLCNLEMRNVICMSKLGHHWEVRKMFLKIYGTFPTKYRPSSSGLDVLNRRSFFHYRLCVFPKPLQRLVVHENLVSGVTSVSWRHRDHGPPDTCQLQRGLRVWVKEQEEISVWQKAGALRHECAHEEVVSQEEVRTVVILCLNSWIITPWTLP